MHPHLKLLLLGLCIWTNINASEPANSSRIFYSNYMKERQANLDRLGRIAASRSASYLPSRALTFGTLGLCAASAMMQLYFAKKTISVNQEIAQNNQQIFENNEQIARNYQKILDNLNKA